MSRIGKKPIIVTNEVDVKIDNDFITVKGPKGELKLKSHQRVTVAQNENELNITVKNPDAKTDKALWGLYGSLIRNMITGVTDGFSKKLEINGVGYKVAQSGNKLTFNLGFSHPIDFPLPEGISATVEKNEITINGFDKQLVGQVAARIRSLRPPEPYKGKGIKYSDETIRRKAGKAAKAAGGDA